MKRRNEQLPEKVVMGIWGSLLVILGSLLAFFSLKFSFLGKSGLRPLDAPMILAVACSVFLSHLKRPGLVSIVSLLGLASMYGVYVRFHDLMNNSLPTGAQFVHPPELGTGFYLAGFAMLLTLVGSLLQLAAKRNERDSAP